MPMEGCCPAVLFLPQSISLKSELYGVSFKGSYSLACKFEVSACKPSLAHYRLDVYMLLYSIQFTESGKSAVAMSTETGAAAFYGISV